MLPLSSRLAGHAITQTSLPGLHEGTNHQPFWSKRMDERPNHFMFDLGDTATIAISDETGKIIGRAEYIENENNYLLLYQANDGRAVKQWWKESELKPRS
jgi:hypothetical protein